MTHETTTYKAYQIIQRVDVKSHSCIIYSDGQIVKPIAGDIFMDGTNNAIEKAKLFIDKLLTK